MPLSKAGLICYLSVIEVGELEIINDYWCIDDSLEAEKSVSAIQNAAKLNHREFRAILDKSCLGIDKKITACGRCGARIVVKTRPDLKKACSKKQRRSEQCCSNCYATGIVEGFDMMVYELIQAAPVPNFDEAYSEAICGLDRLELIALASGVCQALNYSNGDESGYMSESPRFTDDQTLDAKINLKLIDNGLLIRHKYAEPIEAQQKLVKEYVDRYSDILDPNSLMCVDQYFASPKKQGSYFLKPVEFDTYFDYLGFLVEKCKEPVLDVEEIKRVEEIVELIKLREAEHMLPIVAEDNRLRLEANLRVILSLKKMVNSYNMRVVYNAMKYTAEKAAYHIYVKKEGELPAYSHQSIYENRLQWWLDWAESEASSGKRYENSPPLDAKNWTPIQSFSSCYLLADQRGWHYFSVPEVVKSLCNCANSD